MRPPVAHVLKQVLHRPGRQDVAFCESRSKAMCGRQLVETINPTPYKQEHKMAVTRRPQGGAVHEEEHSSE